MKKILVIFLLINVIAFAKGEKMFGFKYHNVENESNEYADINVDFYFKNKNKFNGFMDLNIKAKNFSSEQYNKAVDKIYYIYLKALTGKYVSIVSFNKNYSSFIDENNQTILLKKNHGILMITWRTKNNYNNLINYFKFNNDYDILKLIQLSKLDLDEYNLNENLDKLK